MHDDGKDCTLQGPAGKPLMLGCLMVFPFPSKVQELSVIQNKP